jgi:hypothetical protein
MIEIKRMIADAGIMPIGRMVEITIALNIRRMPVVMKPTLGDGRTKRLNR